MDSLGKKRLLPLVLAFGFVFCESFVFIQPAVAFDGKYDPLFYASDSILFYNPQDSCASSGGSTTQLSGLDNRQKIWNYLIARGLSSEQTAGVMGNIQSESAGSWNPMVNEYSQDFGDGGFGIVQWTGGRRDNIVDYLTTNVPYLMELYYNADYSSSSSATTIAEGFIARDNRSGELMPVDHNDRLLLAELDFLYDESNNRQLSGSAINLGLGEDGLTEWEALKQVSTVQEASDLWVYSFERPADIATTAIARAINGQAIYDIYSLGGECEISMSKQELARNIMASPNLSFMAGTNTARQRQLLQDVADGTNDGNAWPCGVNLLILKMIWAILDSDHTLLINDLNRACTDSTAGGLSSHESRHYNGNGSALDLGRIDGMTSFSPQGADLIIGIVKPYLLDNSGVGQVQNDCLPSLDVPSGTKRFIDGCNHLHIDVSPNSDPELKCKTPVYYGGCDPSQRV